jgi:hypothetical protein
LFAVLLERCEQAGCASPTEYVAAYVARKADWRTLHSQHEREAFPDDPYDGKELINMSAFGSSAALRSPHLWLMQRQLWSAALSMLERPEYAPIASASHLSARPRPEWSKICVLLQTWEDEELQRLLAALCDDVDALALKFDSTILQFASETSIGKLLAEINVRKHVCWEVKPFTSQATWFNWVSGSARSQEPSAAGNCILDSLRDCGVPRDDIGTVVEHMQFANNGLQ